MTKNNDAPGHDHVHGEHCNHDHGPRQEPVRNLAPKLGRNDPCHCGNGRKFKVCHGKAG